MNKCPKCGKYIPEGGKMCIACGWKPEQAGYDMKDNPFAKYLQDVMDKMSPDFPGKTEKTDEYREAELAALGYIGPAFLYSLYKAKDSKLVRYHANQACLLLIASALGELLAKIPLVGKSAKRIYGLALVVMAFAGARNAYFKKFEPVPYIGTLGIKIIK